jgi:endo-1,4-beta-xylanase
MRIHFLTLLLIAGNLLLSCKGGGTPQGEEWRNSIHEQNDSLRPREVVLQEAKENIEKHRKGELVLVLNQNEESLAGKKVQVQMIEHYFDWGCSPGRRSSFHDEDSYIEYMQFFRALFNASTAKCYWNERWHQPIEKKEGKRILDVFLEEVETGYSYGMRVKGHPLVWTVPKAIPDWLKKYSREERLVILEKHVKDMVRQGGDRIHNWDVVNEMLWEPAFKNIYERHWPHIDSIDEIADYVALALQWVKEENPKPLRIINDYGLIKEFNPYIIPYTSVKEQRNRYIQLVKALQERNAPLDAIGVQSHVGTWYEPDEIVIAYDELAATGLPIHITEFWARIKDCPVDVSDMTQTEKDSLLKQYLIDFYTVAFGHPAVEHITYWGNPFFDKNMQPTFMYHALYNLIRKEWTTHGEFVTDARGQLKLRAFYGEYLIKVEDKEIPLTFTPDLQNTSLHDIDISALQ